jgi:hypothetical protein
MRSGHRSRNIKIKEAGWDSATRNDINPCCVAIIPLDRIISRFREGYYDGGTDGPDDEEENVTDSALTGKLTIAVAKTSRHKKTTRFFCIVILLTLAYCLPVLHEPFRNWFGQLHRSQYV